MKVEKLSLRNFRNVAEASFAPSPGLNFLLGKNGQGKTSFLEALGYLATLRSFRGSKTPEVVRWGADEAEVTCALSSSDEVASSRWETELKVTFQVNDVERTRASKIAFINGKPFRSSTSYLSQRFGSFELGFHTVIFNPSDHDLVRADPGTRRAYLDRVIAAEDVEYLKDLQRYQRVLEQRNAVLKNSDRPNPDLLAGFTEPLASFAARLTYRRLEWLSRLAVRLNDVVHQIAPSQPKLNAVYVSGWAPPIAGLSITNSDLGGVHFAGHDPLNSIELLEQAFWKRLSEVGPSEWRIGHTLVGPHRDDWSFYLGGQLLKGHGSQGEVRSALLALKLCEIELFRQQTGHRPLFLLDDFSSELDRERRSFLLKFLTEADLQTFVTSTEDSGFTGRRYWVHEGTLSELTSGKDLEERAHERKRSEPD